MPVANNSADLEQMIIQQMQKAMQETQRRVENDMLRETQSFYSQGSPSWYTRTGGIGRTPKTTGITSGGTSVSFEAYLDENQGWYGAGNPNPAFTSRGFPSNFSPLQVLTAAENSTNYVLGRGGFWQRTLVDIEKDINTVFGSYFN